MADKQINIHVGAPGAEEVKHQLDGVATTAQGVGDKTNEAGKKGAEGTEQASRKLGAMGGILHSLRSQVAGFVGAWLGLQGVQRVVNWLIEKLERIASLQADIYDKSIKLATVGQALENQTRTSGQQGFWAQQAVELQKAGGLESAEAAQQMLISMDIAFAAQGGIKSPGVRELGKKLAPFFGGMQMGGEDVAKSFEFAASAGIAPNEEAYKEYFAKLTAAFTASKATSLGAFVVGLQKGATGYIGGGGSLDEALATYSAARSVSANESLAATMLEQTARLSEGGYEKPRKAIERGMGLKWGDLSMDQRKDALLAYVRSLPASQRGQILSRQGFPVELTSQLGKLVGSEAQQVYAQTKEAVGGATAADVDSIAESYMASTLGLSRASEATIEGMDIAEGPAFATWQRRLREATRRHEGLVAKGQDSITADRIEPQIMAMQAMREEMDAFVAALPEGDLRTRAVAMRAQLSEQKEFLGSTPFIPRGLATARGYGFEQEFMGLREEAKSQQPVYDYSMNYYPTTESKEERRIGQRFYWD
jgi:hypothetical protein